MKLTLFKQKISLPTVLGVTADAEEARNKLAMQAVAVLNVTTPEEQAVAAAALAGIQRYMKAVKEAGLEFRRPVNDVSALIKRTEDDHLQPLLTEKDRISRLLANFDAQERRRVAEEERKRQEEFQRANEERMRLEREAAEKAAKAAASGKKKDVKAAEAAFAAAQTADVAVQTVIDAPVASVSKASGVGVRKVLRWEVTDIRALVQARPDLCRIEPKGSAIQATCIPEMPNLPPGLKLWWETTAVVNSTYA